MMSIVIRLVKILPVPLSLLFSILSFFPVLPFELSLKIQALSVVAVLCIHVSYDKDFCQSEMRTMGNWKLDIS